MVSFSDVKSSSKKFDPSEILLPLADFLRSYNKTIPEGFPKASRTLLEKYKSEHQSFFKHEDQWSIADHRKRIMDWLPLNIEHNP